MLTLMMTVTFAERVFMTLLPRMGSFTFNIIVIYSSLWSVEDHIIVLHLCVDMFILQTDEEMNWILW